MSTITPVATTHATMADFLANAVPGDTFTDHGKRSTTTHVFVQRDDDGPQLGGAVDVISTHHFGRAEYSGRPEYCFRSIMQTLPMSVRRYKEDGGCAIITRAYSLQYPATGLGSSEAPRFSAKRLQEAHVAAVNLYREHLS